MAFTDIELKETYDSDEDDILNNFYIPTLSNSIKYDRLAGYFSSTSLAASAKGMGDFLKNKGKMRLITCVQISEQDQKAIKDGTVNPEEVLSKIILDELDIAEQIQKDHVSALAWMIANGNLTIKIAVPLRKNNYHTEELDRNSIYHQKVGILYDKKNNIISFSGSINETGRAWTGNIEEFKVFCDWKEGQDVFGASDAKKFEKFWHDQSKNTKIFDLPTAVKKHLIINAPKSEAEAINKIQNTLIISHGLREYQNDAVKKWFKNNNQGVFEMATGTGKTWAAIACIKKIFEKSNIESNLVVITCPNTHLITQWENELKKWNIKSKAAYSKTSWKRELNGDILQLNHGVIKKMVIVTTHVTFSSTAFIDMIKLCKVKSFIIVDEVHKIGTEKRSSGLLNTYDYRLGLSATPKRYFDDIGTKKILEYFDDIIFKFGLKQAINEGYLTHYHFFPHIVYMTNDESKNYYKYSKAIAIEASKDNPDRNKIDRLSFKRSDIIKAAKNKLEKFKEIIQNNLPLDHCLVYCISKQKQLINVCNTLHEMRINFHRFTEQEDDPKYRKKLLDEFSEGDKAVLVAIKCLDEGVDVPSTKMAIILASSHNPIEFIQRRGRILRIHDRKKYAIIHDLIVLPRSLPTNEIYTESEKKIIRDEFDRLEDFSNSSDNPDYSKKLIQTFMSQYDL